MKKFELISEFVTNVFGKKLFRIKALVSFGDVSAGELGGFVEKEENLSNNGNAWVSGNAWSPAMRGSPAMQTFPSLQALVDVSARPHFSDARIKFSAYSVVAFMVIWRSSVRSSRKLTATANTPKSTLRLPT